MSGLVTLDEIRAAQERIAPFVMRTPLCEMSDSGLSLKAESLQPSGAFKLRGAFNSLLQLDGGVAGRGVVAHSSGNHAIAVAYAASALQMPAVIVMPEDAPRMKLDWTSRLGAEVVIVGPASSERAGRAGEISDERRWPLIEPYDSSWVISATGTAGIEILEQLGARSDDGFDLYAPSSGGGLISGVAAAMKLSGADCRVIAVEPEIAANARASRQAGERVTLESGATSQTIADGLRVQRLGELNWLHIEEHVDEIVTVTDDEICEAMRAVASQARLVAEPSGAASVAAAIVGRGGSREPRRRVAVVSGGNVDPDLYVSVLSG